MFWTSYKNSEHFADRERFAVLLLDEMTTKSDLVFDRWSKEMIGFINNYVNPIVCKSSCFNDFQNTDINMTLDILEHGLSLLCPLFWEAVGHLKTKFKLNVIASTSDKASPNQRL